MVVLRKTLFATVLWLVASVSSARGDVINLDFTPASNGWDFDASTGVFTISGGTADGLQISVSSFVNSVASGTINATNTSLGVNAPGGADETAQLDAAEGIESLNFAFSNTSSLSSVKLTELSVSSFGAADSGTITIGASANPISSLSSTSIPAHTNLEDSSFTVTYGSTGNGFGLLGMKLAVTAVPEPSGVCLLLLATLSGAIRRRRS